MPTVYEANQFQGQTLELDDAVWRDNLFDGCVLKVNRPPADFAGNSVGGCRVELGQEMIRAMRFIRAMSQIMPSMRAQLRRELGLDDEANGNAVLPLKH